MGLYIPGKGFRVLRGQGRIGFVGILQVPVELGKAQYMLVFLTEKPAFFQPADIPVGEMDILRDGYRAAIGQKNRVKGRTFLAKSPFSRIILRCSISRISKELLS